MRAATLFHERIDPSERPRNMTPIGDEACHSGGRTAAPEQDRVAEACLLDLARAGDLDAFVELIGMHDRALRALVYRLLGDAQRMDDTLQEAYLKALRSLHGFEGRSAFGSWLHRIVYNVCMDQLRRRRSGAQHLSLEEVDGLADSMPDPGEVASQRLDLAAALASLPPELRATVLLVDAEGMDYQTSAQVLGIPVGTVRSRLNRARGLLRQALSADERGRDGS